MAEGIDWNDPILGLDLSSVCIGVAVLRGRDYHTEHINLRGELPEKLHTFRRWLRWYVPRVQPAVIAIEAPIVGQGNSAATGYQFNGVAREALCKAICPVDEIYASTWKKQVHGNGRIDKKKGHVLLSLNKMNFDVRQLDEADALSVALCMRKKLFGRILDEAQERAYRLQHR